MPSFRTAQLSGVNYRIMIIIMIYIEGWPDELFVGRESESLGFKEWVRDAAGVEMLGGRCSPSRELD